MPIAFWELGAFILLKGGGQEQVVMKRFGIACMSPFVVWNLGLNFPAGQEYPDHGRQRYADAGQLRAEGHHANLGPHGAAHQQQLDSWSSTC